MAVLLKFPSSPSSRGVSLVLKKQSPISGADRMQLRPGKKQSGVLPDLNVPTGHLGVSWRCRFQLRRSGLGPERRHF